MTNSLQWSSTQISYYIGLSSEEMKEREARLGTSMWFNGLQDQILYNRAKFARKDVFQGNPTRRKNFKLILQKTVVGSDSEKKILQSLRIDAKLSCSISLLPKQLEEIDNRGLTDHFAKAINKVLPAWEIPEWVVNKAINYVQDFQGNSALLADLYQLLAKYPASVLPPPLGRAQEGQDTFNNSQEDSLDQRPATDPQLHASADHTLRDAVNNSQEDSLVQQPATDPQFPTSADHTSQGVAQFLQRAAKRKRCNTLPTAYLANQWSTEQSPDVPQAALEGMWAGGLVSTTNNQLSDNSMPFSMLDDGWVPLDVYRS